jgi:hypothetical protein
MPKERTASPKPDEVARRKKILQRIRKEVDAAHRAAVNELRNAEKDPPGYFKVMDQHIKMGGYFKGPKK